jgi:hypothetical protein
MNADQRRYGMCAGQNVPRAGPDTALNIICNTMMKLRAQTTKIWSAVTHHRFGFFGDSSPKKRCVQRPAKKVGVPSPFDGDKSAQSKARDCGTSRVSPLLVTFGKSEVGYFLLGFGTQFSCAPCVKRPDLLPGLFLCTDHPCRAGAERRQIPCARPVV